MAQHWFVIVNREKAKIYIEDAETKELRLLKLIQNPLGLEKRSALFHKDAGMGVRSIGTRGSVRHMEGKRTDPEEDASLQFARELCKELWLSLQRKDFENLTIVAEPHFLGKIKAEMNPHLEKSVINWLRKDLQKIPDSELGEFLQSKEIAPEF